MATGVGGWVVRPEWANAAAAPIKMGIATDITGAIAPSGNANWQVAQFAVEEINKAGGIARPADRALPRGHRVRPKVAVGNVRKLIQSDKVDVVLGGITSAMRQAIKDPIVARGSTLYIYPQLYEGQECTPICSAPAHAGAAVRQAHSLPDQERRQELRHAARPTTSGRSC